MGGERRRREALDHAVAVEGRASDDARSAAEEDVDERAEQ